MQGKQVTVIIPAKNEENYIARCLRSVLDQDYPGHLVKVVVVDNGSTDGTRAIVDSFAQTGRVELLVREGGTISAVRNLGAAQAQGSYLAFLDGDCVPAPDWLRSGIEFLQRQAEVVCIGFAASPPDPAASWVERTWHHLCSTSRSRGTRKAAWLSSFNLIMRRDVFLRVGGFNEALATCEDADLGYRLSAHGSLLLSDSCSVRHLDEPTTLSQFFRKELWRGQSSMRNFLQSSQKKEDFLSVCVPILYLGLVTTCCALVLAGRLLDSRGVTCAAWCSLALTLLVPLLNVFYKTRRLLTASQMARAYLLSTVYLVARGLVVVQHVR